MNKKNETGAFCITYGTSINNRILEYMLENQDIDFAIGDMAREINVSKPKAYESVKSFEEKGYVKKSRIVGKTQLYALNKGNKRVKLFLRDFKECLKLILEDYSCEEDPVLARVFLGKIDVTEKILEEIKNGF